MLSPLPPIFCFRDEKSVNLLYFHFFFLMSLITIYSNWPKNIKKNIIKGVLVSIKPKFSDKFSNFYEKNQNSLFSKKFKLFLILQKNWNSVSL